MGQKHLSAHAIIAVLLFVSTLAGRCTAQETNTQPPAKSETTSQPTNDEGWESLLDTEMSNFDTWLGKPHGSVKGLPDGYKAGLNNDVKNVFSVVDVDGQPVLKITGEIWGGISTKKVYENFHFRTKFRWGEKKHKPRQNKKRDSGILYHCVGEHGEMYGFWKKSIEFQVQEKDLGDLYAMGTTAEVRISDNGKNEKLKKKYDPDSEEYLTKGDCSAAVEPDAPHGEWNDLEIYTVGNTSVHIANGQILMILKTCGTKENLWSAVSFRFNPRQLSASTNRWNCDRSTISQQILKRSCVFVPEKMLARKRLWARQKSKFSIPSEIPALAPYSANLNSQLVVSIRAKKNFENSSHTTKNDWRCAHYERTL